MRTTITLDPDVERILKTVMRERGVSFKEAINDAVRTGLAGSPTLRRTRFVQKTASLGSEQNFRWEKALATADAIEDEQLVQKIALRK